MLLALLVTLIYSHAFLMMSPRSQQQAFYRTSNGRCGLNVISGIKFGVTITRPILFPSHGGCVNPGGALEVPDPREGCAGDFQQWRGLPVWAQLPAHIDTSGASATITMSDGTSFSSSAGNLCVQTKVRGFLGARDRSD